MVTVAWILRNLSSVPCSDTYFLCYLEQITQFLCASVPHLTQVCAGDKYATKIYVIRNNSIGDLRQIDLWGNGAHFCLCIVTSQALVYFEAPMICQAAMYKHLLEAEVG